ncbi:MAG: phosphoadenosine phosphosulfate reductase family protein, partial [Verrucomicrobiota bacterium]
MTAQLEAIGLEDLATATPEDRVRWAHEQYGDDLIMTSSFGTHSAMMLHLVTSVLPDIPVVFIDTGYLFPETYRCAAELTERLTLNVKKERPMSSAAEGAGRQGG